MNSEQMRIGSGFDAHRFDKNRPLVIGGVTIEGEAGLEGDSDGDVLCHAISDALLGAASLGDLGTHFGKDQIPDGGSSLAILSATTKMLREAGYAPVNVDATVIIQSVRISGYRDEMAKNVASAVGLDPNGVNVKATTTDGLGFTGRNEGAAAIATVLIRRA